MSYLAIVLIKLLHFANSTFAFHKWYIIDPTIVTPSNQMGWAMHQLGELRRNRRTKLKKDHKKLGMTREQVLATQPPGVITAQWTEMVDYWFNDKTEVLLLSLSISSSW